MKVWRPKDPRAVALIKLTLWSGLIVWMLFTLTLGILMAIRFIYNESDPFGAGTRGTILEHTVPVWIIFTTLMLIWAVATFAHKRLKGE